MEQRSNEIPALTWSWGKNKDGELSQSSNKDVLQPKPVKGLRGKNLIMVTSAGQHSAAVDNTGRLYVAGSYLHGKLGLQDLTTVCVPTFTLVQELRDCAVVQVACGDYHTLCLCNDGAVYTWGGTLHKKLGQRGKELNRPGLVTSLQGKDIVYVDCGDFHSVALTADGKIYSWGGGGSFFNRGQCGHGHTNDVESPELIQGLKQHFITQISSGGYHTLALTDNNEVFAWGSGLYGECGFGEFISTSMPRKVVFPWAKRQQDLGHYGNVAQIAAGGHHSLILTENGQVLSFGFASHGQLGLRSTVNQCEAQHVVCLRNKRIKMIAAGWNHSLVLTQQGDIFACGYGLYGQLGQNSDESITYFVHIRDFGPKKVERIYAGGNHSWALLDPAQPIRFDYEPPSPVLSEASSPQLTPRASPISEDVVISNQDLPVQRPEYILQVAYTDVQYCHRFVRFQLKETSMINGKKKAEKFVHKMYQAETGLQYHRIQEDDDIVSTTEEGTQIISQGTGDSFTCLLVCDPGRNTPPIPTSEFTGDPQQNLMTLKPQQLTSNPVQCALSEWIRMFLRQVGAFCATTPKFFELRPLSFYIPN